ncbi:pentatricopeptide repeat-containing protein At4g01990, mitochondrial-like [Lolium rigidum]|uniref:pentatricopeptide repeat-containing protein At4g01990, mitochondrial-like n=1 Tax=Lolium rigidum TaxID=89674 RepID=UPI001F5C61BE|nr:pentatricopeptide repeat-containing protein At4g01990, mitochondrial-like [Lolium rigidum]
MAALTSSAGCRLLRRFLSTASEVASEAIPPVAKKEAHPVRKKVASKAAHGVAKDAKKAAHPAAKVASESARPVEEDAKKAATKDSRPLYRRLSALGNAGEGSVSGVLNKWVREGRETRSVDLERYVKELRKYKRHPQALELMDWMVHTKGMNMSYTNHAIRLDLIYKVRGIEAAEKYFDGLPDPAKNHRTYGALLNCYCSSKKEEKATDIYRKMDELGISSSTLPINNLMSLYMKLGQHKKVASLFEEMKEKNIKPNNLTCCVLMTSYAALNKIDNVEEVQKEMEERNILGWSAYSTLASIYLSAGLVEKAESALKKLEGLVEASDGRQPFDFLMSLYASVGNLSEVNRVWDVVKDTFPKVTNTSYFSMLQALLKLNDADRMKQIFEEWESNHECYDAKLTNVMTRAHLKNGMAKEAELLWEKAKEKGGNFDSKTCELFLDHYMGTGDMKSALNWVENVTKLPKKTAKLDQEKIHKFSKYFEEQKDVEGADRFCRCLRILGCIDGKAYESLLRTYLAAGQTSRSLRQQIKDDKIEICYDIGKLLTRMGDKGR